MRWKIYVIHITIAIIILNYFSYSVFALELSKDFLGYHVDNPIPLVSDINGDGNKEIILGLST